MKRVRAQAIVVSSDSEGNADDSDSHFEPPKKQKKCPPSAKTTAGAKSSPKVKKVKKTVAKGRREETVAERVEEPGSVSWTPAEIISRDLNLELNNTLATCSLLEAGNSLPFLAR